MKRRCPEHREEQRGTFSSLSRTALLFLLLLAGCSHATKHEILTFFFDGVPGPESDEEAGKKEDPKKKDLPETIPRVKKPPRNQRPPIYKHTAYKERRCKQCHEMYQVKLVQEVEDGLCIACHKDPPGESKYVHGPVAVNACLECHHYHSSPYPNVVVKESKPLCYQCHWRNKLSEGDPHKSIDSPTGGSCTECHDPHGADNPMFLKRSK